MQLPDGGVGLLASGRPEAPRIDTMVLLPAGESALLTAETPMMSEELSPEDQIAATGLVRAAPEMRLCDAPHCKVKLAMANKGTMCFRHSQMMKARGYEGSLSKTPPEITPEARLCAVKGCDTPVSNHSLSGRCSIHIYLRKGLEMKNGSIPNPFKAHTLPIPSGAAKICSFEGCTKLLSPRNTSGRCSYQHPRRRQGAEKEFITGAELSIATEGLTETMSQFHNSLDKILSPDSEFVSLKVPTEALDRFWARMSTDDKLRIIEREMFGS
jgi:hypothetical protein